MCGGEALSASLDDYKGVEMQGSFPVTEDSMQP